MMFLATKSIADFVNRHPAIKMLAFSFPLLAGIVLVTDDYGRHIEKGCICFAMAFSFGVKVLNIRARLMRKSEPVELRPEY